MILLNTCKVFLLVKISVKEYIKQFMDLLNLYDASSPRMTWSPSSPTEVYLQLIKNLPLSSDGNVLI